MYSWIPFEKVQPEIWTIFVVLNFVFVILYLQQYFRYGVLTLGVFFFVRSVYISSIFLIPFVYSENNRGATGHFYDNYVPYIPLAVLIVVIGIISLVLGALVARAAPTKVIGFGVIKTVWQNILLSRLGVWGLALISLLLIVVMLLLGFSPGNARADSFSNPIFRPIYNLSTVTISFAILSAFAYGYSHKSKRYYLLGVFMIMLGLFGGTRATSVGVLITVIAIFAIVNRTKNLLPLVLGFGGLLVLAVYISGFRDGVYDFSYIMRVPIRLLFGNDFSDLRDTAWILSGWNRELLMGQTYISGFLSFIPSAILTSRTESSWAYFSLVSSGLGEEAISYHPGLRPVIFGEPFFNFGFLGVIVSGFVIGYVLFSLDYTIKRIPDSDKPTRLITTIASITYLDYFLMQFIQSAGFFVFYVVCCIFFTGFILNSLSGVSLARKKVLE